MRPFPVRYLLLVLCIVSSNLFAQTVFPETGRWNQKYHSIAWGHGGEVIWDITEYHTYTSTGTTVINNQTFTILNLDGQFNSYILTDGLKVYRGVEADSLQLFYDYGLNPGDTFRFPAPNFSSYPYEIVLEVLSVDTVFIGGENRRRLVFSDIPSYGNGPLWIQGIGDVNFGGIETDYSYTSWNANTKNLECFADNGVNIYGTCTLGYEKRPALSKLYPNPGRGIFHLQLDAFHPPLHIAVFSTDGRLIQSFESAQSYENIQLEKGVYLLKISDSMRTETIRAISY